jgi:sec-independent protein translocase protein TatC
VPTVAMKLSLPFVKRGPRTPRSPDGQMTLFEHLAELRSRLVKAAAFIVLGMIAFWFLYDPLFHLFSDPFYNAVRSLNRANLNATINFGDIGSPLLLKLKIVAAASLTLTSPFWLWQLWAFVMPGLHRKERKWTYLFVGSAGPLFIAGVLIGYYALPKGLAVLVNFTPAGSSNFINASGYLSFMIRLLLVFGVAFEIPIVVIILNMVGVLSSKVLSKARPFIIFGIFVFAAVATPSTDPFTMLLLAVPMTVLFIISEIIARIVEKRRKAGLAAQGIDLSIDDDD